MLCMQIKRDLHRIGGNLVLVVFPFKNRDQQSAALRNWDLWGPMVGGSLSGLPAIQSCLGDWALPFGAAWYARFGLSHMPHDRAVQCSADGFAERVKSKAM